MVPHFKKYLQSFTNVELPTIVINFHKYFACVSNPVGIPTGFQISVKFWELRSSQEFS